MDWKTKLDVCNQLAEEDDDLSADFGLFEPADAASLVSVESRLPAGYLEFLQVGNGADIAQCVLCGTENLAQADESYSDLFEALQPFGWDAGGTPFFFDADGRVYIGHSPISREQPRCVAPSFAAFLNDVLMGQQYPALYDEEPEDDEWYDFLCRQSWA